MERFSYAKHIGFRTRATRVGLAMVALLAILVVRLVHLQIILGDAYRRLSDNNRYRLQRLDGPRGLILDRNGEVLVDNRPAFVLNAVPREVDDPAGTVGRLAELVAIDSERAIDRISQLRRSSTNMAMRVRIKDDLPFDEVARVEEAMTELPGVIIVSSPVRRYVFGDLAASVLGYLGEIDEGQLKRLKDRGYLPGNLIGKTGVEKVCEEHLRGTDGGVLIEVHSVGKPQLGIDFRQGRREQFWVDSLGRRLRAEREHRREAVAGHDVYLSIDRRIQQLAERALGDATGAIVVMDTDTGEVLALASNPSYDPNIFVTRGNAEQVHAVLNDQQHPLLNRAFQASYAPGSTVKPMVAIAGLEEGVITSETKFTCCGWYDIGRRFRCWNRGGHGSINVVDAVAYSCDVFFYQLAERLGPRTIAHYFHLFGLGQGAGLGLPGEKTGLLPTAEWKRRQFGESWYGGDTANLSIGQGAMLATPTQMARAYAALVNGGRLVEPRLVLKITSSSGDIVHVPERDAPLVAGIRRETLQIVTQALRKAVDKETFPTGTGYRAKVRGIEILGKTGTAQVVGRKQDDEEEVEPDDVPYKLRDHAWFVAVVTNKQPRIVVVTLMEHSGHGGETAAPVTGNLIRAIYAGEQVPEPYVVAAVPDATVATRTIEQHQADDEQRNSAARRTR